MSDHRDPAALEPTSSPSGLTRHRLHLMQRLAKAGCTERMVGSDDMVWSDDVYRMLGLVPRVVRPSLTLWRGRVHPDDQTAVDAAWSSLESQGVGHIDISYRVRHEQGPWIQVRELAERWQPGPGQLWRGNSETDSFVNQQFDNDSKGGARSLIIIPGCIVYGVTVATARQGADI